MSRLIYMQIANYFFERYPSILALFLFDLSSTHALSSNKPMIMPKTFLTPLRNVWYSSDFSSKASSVNSMLKGALLACKNFHLFLVKHVVYLFQL